MLNDQALRVIRADNAWLEGGALGPWLQRLLPPLWIPRRLELELGERACLVVGPRQAGKSSLIWKTLAEYGEPALWVNCEEPSVVEWLQSPAGFLADLPAVAPLARTVFFEEVQRLPDAGLFLKGLVDRRPPLRIVATGSSAFELNAATRESLAGRARRHLLLPLSLAEVGSQWESPPAVIRQRLDEELQRHLVFGGYPAVVTADRPAAELAGLVEAFVIRDASDRFRIRHPRALRQILALAASQIGNLVSFSEWAAHTGIHGTTVREYCALLEEVHVLRMLRPFVGGKRAEITSAPKAYFVDTGIRNQVMGGFAQPSDRTDRGALLETVVFAELAKCLNPLLDRLHYWRSTSGAEVDFVVVRDDRITGIEVKSGPPRGNLSRSARSFIDAYQPEAFLMVTGAEPTPRPPEDSLVRVVRPWELAAHFQR